MEEDIPFLFYYLFKERRISEILPLLLLEIATELGDDGGQSFSFL